MADIKDLNCLLNFIIILLLNYNNEFIKLFVSINKNRERGITYCVTRKLFLDITIKYSLNKLCFSEFSCWKLSWFCVSVWVVEWCCWCWICWSCCCWCCRCWSCCWCCWWFIWRKEWALAWQITDEDRVHQRSTPGLHPGPGRVSVRLCEEDDSGDSDQSSSPSSPLHLLQQSGDGGHRYVRILK